MILESEDELKTTQEKLARLEARYITLQHQTGGDEVLRQATISSLIHYINQFKEQIAVYYAHQLVRTP